MNLVIDPAAPFWRPEPLVREEQALLYNLFDAHAVASMRNNISTATFRNAFAGSRSYTSALASALCTVGAVHGPIQETYRLLEGPLGYARTMLANGEKVPGWGNSFIKGAPDGGWRMVDECIAEHWPEMSSRLAGVTSALRHHGLDLYPNPSAYTAAAAIILGMPCELSPFLFVAARLVPWTQLLLGPNYEVQ